jgi:2-phosphoglycerate kinase
MILRLQFTKIIETVDITNLVRSMQTNKLSEDWQLSSYPAFAAVTVKNGNIHREQ